MRRTRDKLTRKFKDKDYRHIYTASFFDTLLATQIRALRTQEKLSQKELGRRTGTKQSGISAFENTDYSRWSVSTLRKFSREFDVALVVKFESFGKTLDEVESFNKDSIFIPSFDEDPTFHESAVSTSQQAATHTVDFPLLGIHIPTEATGGGTYLVNTL